MGRATGCTDYVRGTLHIRVAFPKQYQGCKYCDLLRREDGIRFRCMATNRLVYDPDCIHDGCPIEWDKEETQ